MSQFLIGKGVEIKVDDVLYVGDDEGVVDLPSEHDERMVNVHGLTRYIPKPVDSDKGEAPAPETPKRGRPTKADSDKSEA